MKSKFYQISRVDETTMLVLSTSFHSPVEQIEHIEKDLSKKNFNGKVVFDMLLTNGDIKNRFFESIFENRKINRITIKQSLEQVEQVVAASRVFYTKHIKLVEESLILSNATKFLVKKGIF